jgi:NhaA family Na+:H+ antiporter
VAGVLVLLMFVMNRLRIHNIGMYGVLGLCLWVAVLFSGVHATIAGVLLAIMIPSGSHIDPPVFAQKARGIMDRIAQKVVNNEGRGSQLDLVHSLEDMCREVQSPLHRIEHGMQPYINFLVMPVFALVNAGVRLDPTVIEHLTSPVALGIMIGLVVGKQVGVTFAVWLGVRFGIAELPSHVSLRMIYGVSLLCGIGFSMALFVANLAFKPGESLDTARLSVLVASTVSAIAGFIALRYWLPPVTPRLDAA